MWSVCGEGGEEHTNRRQSVYFIFFTCISSLGYFPYVFQFYFKSLFVGLWVPSFLLIKKYLSYTAEEMYQEQDTQP